LLLMSMLNSILAQTMVTNNDSRQPCTCHLGAANTFDVMPLFLRPVSRQQQQAATTAAAAAMWSAATAATACFSAAAAAAAALYSTTL
jgi:hypothetical protein